MVDNSNASANPNVGAAPALASDLPEAIRNGGTVETILDRARDPLDLIRRIRFDLDSIRSKLRNQAGTPTWQSRSVEERYASAIQPQYGMTFNPVFRYCLARHEGMVDLSNDLYQRAGHEYLDHKPDYEAVLSVFIPSDFRQEMDHHLAHEAYRKGSNCTAADDWGIFLEIFNQNVRGDRSDFGIATGLQSLDESISGLDGVMFLAGDKGVGKTTLMLSTMVAALRSDPKCAALFFTLDLDRTRIYERLVCHVADIDFQTLKSQQLNGESTQQIQAAVEELTAHILPRVRFVERQFPPPCDGHWSNAWTRASNDLLNATGCSKLILFIDLFQRMDVPVRVGSEEADGPGQRQVKTESDKDDFRLDQIKEFRLRFRTQSQPQGPPVVVASEIRKADHRHELTRDDLKGSGRLASDADTILLMWQKNEQFDGSESVPITLRIAKGRDGVIRRDIPLLFHHTRYQFTEDSESHRTRSPRGESANPTPRPAEPQVDPLAER